MLQVPLDERPAHEESAERRVKRIPKEQLKAFKIPILLQNINKLVEYNNRKVPRIYIILTRCLKAEGIITDRYNRNRRHMGNVTLTELLVFIEESKTDLLESFWEQLSKEDFGFSMIETDDRLVQFYTGLPNAAQIIYIQSLIQTPIFQEFKNWESHERCGFISHTLMVLMKLRLNMTDKELGARFNVEPHVVNMTMRAWLPVMYKYLYKRTERLFRLPLNIQSPYTRVLDFIAVRFARIIRSRGCPEEKSVTQKAVISIQPSGHLNFASKMFTPHTPESVCIQRCGFHQCVNIMEDVVLAHPEHHHAISSFGISLLDMTSEGGKKIKSASERLLEFRILHDVPLEYASAINHIFPICGALTNYMIVPNFL